MDVLIYSTDDLERAGGPRLLGKAFGTGKCCNGWSYCLVE